MASARAGASGDGEKAHLRAEEEAWPRHCLSVVCTYELKGVSEWLPSDWMGDWKGTWNVGRPG